MSEGRLFGTDGVRGRVGEAPMRPETVLHLGHAAARVLIGEEARQRSCDKPAVLIGTDTRISGYMIEAALGAGFAAAGVDVVHGGALPTPAVAYLTRALRLQAGVVVSASHNASEDNGVKFFSAQGCKLPEAVEQAIEDEMRTPIACVPNIRFGRSRRIDGACRRYIEFCKSTFPDELNLAGLRLVVDGANGAGFEAAPQVFSELGAEVILVGGSPDGLNINADVGATAPNHLARVVRQHQADAGVALDGDGDRLLMADGDGMTYDGDQLLYLVARHLHERSQIEGGVVGTVMSNLGLERALEQIGLPFARSAVGDRSVLEALVQRHWQLGGESSGHIICRHKHSTGDGIIAALQVLAATRHSRRSLRQLTRSMVMYPQKTINVPLPRGRDWHTNEAIAAARARIEQQLGAEGRVLLRASGTEPVLRIMVEARSTEQTEALARSLAQAVTGALA